MTRAGCAFIGPKDCTGARRHSAAANRIQPGTGPGKGASHRKFPGASRALVLLLMQWGTGQKKRYIPENPLLPKNLVPGTLRANHGSDLAAIETRRFDEGDHFTSRLQGLDPNAHHADFSTLLCRNRPDCRQSIRGSVSSGGHEKARCDSPAAVQIPAARL